MKLERLLEIDKSCFSKGCRRNTLGDAYLRRNNPIYRRMMNEAKLSKFSLVEAWPEYYMLPLMQLDRIVREKKIPMVSNRSSYAKLSRQMQGRCTLEEIPNYSNSYHLHEAAHGVAHFLFAKVSCNTKKEKILYALMCESFANTTELLSGMYVRDEVHRWMLKFNCYIESHSKGQRAQRLCYRQLGAKNTVVLTFFAYLYANFLYEKIPLSFAREIIATFGDEGQMTAKQSRSANRILREAAGLNLKFRAQTSVFYFRSRGILKDNNITGLLNFDFFEFLKNNQDWKKIIERMVVVLTV